jgi:hypothetical protein
MDDREPELAGLHLESRVSVAGTSGRSRIAEQSESPEQEPAQAA